MCIITNTHTNVAFNWFDLGIKKQNISIFFKIFLVDIFLLIAVL